MNNPDSKKYVQWKIDDSLLEQLYASENQNISNLMQNVDKQ